MNALEIRDLTKHYTGFSLNHLNLTLPWGCIMGLVGENGAGKSTTIKLILNTISRDGGTVTILGRDNRENLCLSKEEIGVVLDEVGISACLTARQVGKIMQGIYRSWDEAVFSDYLTRLAVPADKKFKDFSRGMKMKLGIAVALSHHPRLLILDEATSGLDPVVRDDGEEYSQAVLNHQTYTSTTIPYMRGNITASDGTVLAYSEKVYNLILDVKSVTSEDGKYH